MGSLPSMSRETTKNILDHQIAESERNDQFIQAEKKEQKVREKEESDPESVTTGFLKGK